MTLLLDLSTVLFAIDILLLALDMLLPRLLLCVYSLCLDYLFLLPRTVLGIALAQLILFTFLLSSLSPPPPPLLSLSHSLSSSNS